MPTGMLSPLLDDPEPKAGAALLWKPPAFSAAAGIQTVKTQCGCHALKMKNRCDFHPVRGKIAAVSYVVLTLKELLKKRNQFIIGSFINFSDKTTIAAFTSAKPNGTIGFVRPEISFCCQSSKQLSCQIPTFHLAAPSRLLAPGCHTPACTTPKNHQTFLPLWLGLLRRLPACHSRLSNSIYP